MEEKQTNLNELVIGTKELEKLKAAKVKIVGAIVKTVGEKENQIVECEVEHPEKTEGTIKISAAKIERNGKLEVIPLWFNKDEDGLIRKGSTLALFMQFVGATNIAELAGKTIDTTDDSNNYQVFKAY